MTENITVFKQNHILITSGGKKIHIDPFQCDDMPHDADFILITHDHYDHFSAKDIERVGNKNTVLIVPEGMRGKAEKIGRCAPVKPGKTYDIYGLQFETVPAYNIGKPFHPKRAGWVGYILKLDGKRIYIAGDTDATDEAKAVKCDVALVPVGGTYTMDAKQAAELINTVKPQFAVPVHYGGIVGKKSDGLDFKNAVNEDIKVELKIGF